MQANKKKTHPACVTWILKINKQDGLHQFFIESIPMAESSISSVTEKAGFQNSSFLLLKTAQNFSFLQFSSINSRGKYSFLWVALNFTLKDTPKM